MTRQVLDALARCYNVSDYLLLAHVEPGCLEVEALLRGVTFMPCEVTVNPERLGIPANTKAAWEHGFSKDDFLVHLEDDTVPARDCLLLMEHCRKAYKDDKNIFSVSAYSRPTYSGKKYYGLSKREWYSYWIVGMWHERFQAVAPIWSDDPICYSRQLINHVKKNDLREVFPHVSRCYNIGVVDGVGGKSPEYWANHQHVSFWASFEDVGPGEFTEL